MQLPRAPSSSSSRPIPPNTYQRRLVRFDQPSHWTASVTAEICAAFGPLLAFLQSPQCRLFSRCKTVVPIYQRDLAELCSSGPALIIVRILRDLSSAGRKFDTFDAVRVAVRSEQQKNAILQLIGNGGNLSALFQDVALYHAQFDRKPWTSALIRPVEDEVAAALLVPTDDDLAAMDDVVGGDLRALARVLSGFLDGTIGGGTVRNKFHCVEELIRAVSLLATDGELGDLGSPALICAVRRKPGVDTYERHVRRPLLLPPRANLRTHCSFDCTDLRRCACTDAVIGRRNI